MRTTAVDRPSAPPRTTMDMGALFSQREADRYTMHSRHLNEQMVRVLKTIGYDVNFCRGQGHISMIDKARVISIC